MLILGSMPGTASIRLGQYYAHPRNAFWPIMASVLDFDPSLPYPERVGRLRCSGIALWDVIGSCKRAGSLDSAIVPDSERPNSVADLLEANRSIGTIIHNGGKSDRAFRRHILPLLDPEARSRLRRLGMPSTSPAHAALSFERKRELWGNAVRAALG